MESPCIKSRKTSDSGHQVNTTPLSIKNKKVNEIRDSPRVTTTKDCPQLRLIRCHQVELTSPKEQENANDENTVNTMTNVENTSEKPVFKRHKQMPAIKEPIKEQQSKRQPNKNAPKKRKVSKKLNLPLPGQKTLTNYFS